jgi:membrane protease YdiL (CAAX protease family)
LRRETDDVYTVLIVIFFVALAKELLFRVIPQPKLIERSGAAASSSLSRA